MKTHSNQQPPSAPTEFNQDKSGDSLIQAFFDRRKELDEAAMPDFDAVIHRESTVDKKPATETGNLVRILFSTVTVAAVLMLTLLVVWKSTNQDYSNFTETDIQIAKALWNDEIVPTDTLMNYYSLNAEGEFEDTYDEASTQTTSNNSDFAEENASGNQTSSDSLLLYYWSSPSESLLDYPAWEDEAEIEQPVSRSI